MSKNKDRNNSPEAEMPATQTIHVDEVLKSFLAGEIDLVCVLGPTATGKTRYAVQLARTINSLLGVDGNEKEDRTGCEIISADSRQVYRGMDIGTGKDLEEYGEIPYHLIDIVDAGTKYNLYEYQKDFEKAYKDIMDRGGVPVLCGGTGLYIQAATCGYALPEVPPDPELRAHLEMEDTPTLLRRLELIRGDRRDDDGQKDDTSEPDSRKRLIRAIEVALYETKHPVTRTAFLPKKTYFIGTATDRLQRNLKIDRRLDDRLQHGLVEEVRSLMDKGVTAEDLIYYGLEYKFITEYLTGVLSFDEMHFQLANAIHQFAKRQMTFFRGMERHGVQIHWTLV